MALSQEIREKFEEKIASFLKKGCTLCGNSTFLINDSLYLIPIVDPETKILQEKGKYVMLATCSNCFLIMSFGTKHAGITD